MIAGTLDGRGHTITLGGKALADTITGTVQNLGLAGKAEKKDVATGSFAMHFSGTIQNCFSVATVSTGGWKADPAGFVADMTGGIIRNSYFSGDAGFGGAFVSGGSVANLLHTVYDKGYGGNVAGISGDNQNLNDTHKIGDYGDDNPVASWLEAVDVLNTDRPDTGYVWVLLEGARLPILQDENNVTVNRSALDKAIEAATSLIPEKAKYTADSWAAVEEALAAANAVPSDVSQDAVNAAARALNDAMSALVKQRAMVPVALPEDGSAIQIATASDLANLGADDSDTTGKYYVLTADIELPSNHNNWRFNPFNGVLDGQGHVLTFNGKRLFPYAEIGEEGVIQNIRFQGTVNGNNSVLGNYFKGAVINCSSNMEAGQGYKTNGFAKNLDGGVISNCYVIGAPDNAFVATKSSGSIVNSYWEQSITNEVSVDVGSMEKTGLQMRTLAFANLMNQNRGDYGVAWGQNSDGYPYFGPNLEYHEPGTEPTEYKAQFTSYAGGDAQLLENGSLTLKITDRAVDGYAGLLALDDYAAPDGCVVRWASDSEGIKVDAESGKLTIAAAGQATITATQVDATGSQQVLVTVKVTVQQGELESIKLVIDGQDVTNGRYTVAGSEWKRISVQEKFEGNDGYLGAQGSQYAFTSSNKEYLLDPMGTEFKFKKPGTATMKVANKVNPAICAEVELTSTYVAATSIVPGISGTHVIHGRNANDWEVSPPRFNPEYLGVSVEPANASYASRDYYQITSSNPEVGVYHNLAFVPVNAGEVTYTATLTDPDTGNVVSGSSTVAYQYENPLSALSLDATSYEMKANEELLLPLQFSGLKDAEGWNISEPSIEWSYSTPGIVEVVRESETGYWKREEGAPDNNMFVLGNGYKICALQEGSVVVTGTPKDQTGNAAPIAFSVMVSGSEDLPLVDMNRIVSDGISHSAQYLQSQNMPYVYGSEWLVFAFQRAGVPISAENQSAYYRSVVAEVAKWAPTKKPTDIERVALALTSLGVDITKVEGINLGAMIYNHPRLDTGSNELAYALIALDAAGVEIPGDAVWTREKLVDALLAYQKEDGGIALGKTDDSEIDTTAMAIQALAPYKEQAAVKSALDKAVLYLKSKLSSPYYGYGTSEAESQVIIALATLGEDPLKAGFGTPYRNIFSHLENTYRLAEGGFCHVQGGKADNMATLQALQAFEAYKRYVAGDKSLWDMHENGGFVPEPDPEPSTSNPGNTDSAKPSSGKPSSGTQQETNAAGSEGSNTSAQGNHANTDNNNALLGSSVSLAGTTCSLGESVTLGAGGQEQEQETVATERLPSSERLLAQETIDDDANPLASAAQGFGLWGLLVLLIGAGVAAFGVALYLKRR